MITITISAQMIALVGFVLTTVGLCVMELFGYADMDGPSTSMRVGGVIAIIGILIIIAYLISTL